MSIQMVNELVTIFYCEFFSPNVGPRDLSPVLHWWMDQSVVLLIISTLVLNKEKHFQRFLRTLKLNWEFRVQIGCAYKMQSVWPISLQQLSKSQSKSKSQIKVTNQSHESKSQVLAHPYSISMKFLENGQEIDSKNLVISFGHVLCFFQGATERLKSDTIVTARKMEFGVGPPARKTLFDCVFSLKFV